MELGAYGISIASSCPVVCVSVSFFLRCAFFYPHLYFCRCDLQYTSPPLTHPYFISVVCPIVALRLSAGSTSGISGPSSFLVAVLTDSPIPSLRPTHTSIPLILYVIISLSHLFFFFFYRVLYFFAAETLSKSKFPCLAFTYWWLLSTCCQKESI